MALATRHMPVEDEASVEDETSRGHMHRITIKRLSKPNALGEREGMTFLRNDT